MGRRWCRPRRNARRWRHDLLITWTVGNSGLKAKRLIINFVIPTLLLMSRDAKRNKNRLIFVCTIILIGHWINSYLLFAPGTLNDHGHLGFLEIGLGIGFLGLFLKIVLNSLSKRNIEIGNHPFLDESKHLHT